MAPARGAGQKAVSTELPDWQRRSVERSLEAARSKARDRCNRFVDAARELLRESGDIDFTVQQCVERSGMSIRTFYTFFAGKDDLLYALYETVIARDVVPAVRAACERHRDPVERLRAFVRIDRAGGSTASRSLTVLHHRLQESRPDELDTALAPVVLFVEELLDGLDGRLRNDLDRRRMATLLSHIVLSAVQKNVLSPNHPISGDDLWTFCAAAVLAGPVPSVAPASA